MLSLAINSLTSIMEFLNSIEISTQKSLNDLPCRLTEMQETQDFNLPQFPVESGTYKGDTIYKMPLKLQARLFVYEKDYSDFERLIDEINFNNEFLTIKNLNGKEYKNLKILQWGRDTSSLMRGAAYYNVSLQELILVETLAISKVKKGAGANVETGAKNPQERKSSGLFKGGQGLGFIK